MEYFILCHIMKKIVNTRNRYSYFIYPCPSIYALMRSINVHQSPFRFPRNHQGTLCHLAWPPGCNRFVSQIGKMRNLAQVCGAVSKAEEEELCLKQLELVSSKLSQPGVTVGTMSDCMVCKIQIVDFGHNSTTHVIADF